MIRLMKVAVIMLAGMVPAASAAAGPYLMTGPSVIGESARTARIALYVDATMNVVLMRSILDAATEKPADLSVSAGEEAGSIDDIRLLISVLNDEVEVLKTALRGASYVQRPRLLAKLDETEASLKALQKAEAAFIVTAGPDAGDIADSVIAVARTDLDQAIDAAVIALQAAAGHAAPDAAFAHRLHNLLGLEAPDPALLDALGDAPAAISAALAVMP